MRFLVTGGLGVNGCWVTRDLLTLGHEPVVFDQRADYSLLSDVRNDFKFVQGDVSSLEHLIEVCRTHRIERVCHLAAVYPDTADANPVFGFAVNATATVNVLEAARTTGIDRVVFTSSIGALSPMTAPHLDPIMEPVDETFPSYPISTVYGAAKVASELMGIQYHRLYGMDFAALRFAAIYGLGKGVGRHGTHNIIWSEIIENAIAGRPTSISQGGDQKLDLIYVRDVARSIVLASTKDSFSGHVFHIGSGQTCTMSDFADGVRSAIPNAQIEIGRGLDPRGLGNQGYYQLDISRARKEFGYEPLYGPKAAVLDWVEWRTRLELSSP